MTRTSTRPVPNQSSEHKEDWIKPTDRTGIEMLVPKVNYAVKSALPAKLRGTEERLFRCLLTELSSNPRLYQCTPISLFAGVIQAAQLGLSIGGPLGEAYLLPFKNGKLSKQYGQDIYEAAFIPGYRGLEQLAYRTGQIAGFFPEKVCEGDEFTVIRGTEQKIIHVPKEPQSPVVKYYYLVAKLTNGGTPFVVKTFQEIVAHRDRYSPMSRAPDFAKRESPWYDVDKDGIPGHGFNQMAFKTLIRELSKRLPASAEMSQALSLDQAFENGSSQSLVKTLLPNFSDETDPSEDLAAKLESEIEKTANS